MSEAKFAPGPWATSGIRISGARLSKERLLVVNGPTVETAGVAYVVYSDKTPRDHVESHAIQRLIAAAPDMYEALNDAEWAADGFCPQCSKARDSDGHSPRCILGNALAKARGEAR